MLIFTLDGDVIVLIVAAELGPPKVHRTQLSTLVMGSDPSCDLVLPETSPRHAKIERGEDGVVLSDLESPSGTFLNGRRIVRARLTSGDQIHLPEPPIVLCESAKTNVIERPDISVFQPQAAEPQDSTRTFTVQPIPEMKTGGRGKRSLGAQSLLHISAALGRPGSLEEKLDEILEYSLELGSFDRAAIWVQDPDKAGEFLHYRHRQAPGWPAPVVSQTILGQVLQGDALIIGDAALDARVEKAMSVQMQNVRTCVALPLRTTDRIWGVLYLDCLDPRPLASEGQQEFLAGFAALAAVAVANSWLAARAHKESLLKDRLTRFFPPTTIEKILAEPQGRLAGGEFLVTILFCDIRNYTGISFEQPPRRVAAWLNDYFSRIVPIVFKYGGTLEKYIGDAMLAIWGAPLEIEPAEQALLACRAAVEIHQAVAEFSKAWIDLPCEVGIGIHHGPAYVGTIGHESYLQYAALGSTTNLAARLCSAAGPGETILSRYLADLLPATQFRPVPRPPVAAKGFPEVVEICVLETAGEETAPTR